MDPIPVWLSLRVAGLALLAVLPIGGVLAVVQARRRYRLRRLVDALILLPLVLPPTVIGFLLVATLGERGWLGGPLGLELTFTPTAAVIASFVVALPIFVKTAQPAIEAVPLELEQVGRTLGLAPVALFFRVTLPCAWRGVLAAGVLAFARALGEFGATLMFAGNVVGRTNTMPLEIFVAYQTGNDDLALAYVGILTLLSLGVVLVSTALAPRSDFR